MIDYLKYQESVRNPLDQAMAGYQTGIGIKQREESAIAAKANMEASNRMHEDVFNLSKNKTATAKDYSNMMLKYPEMAKVLSEPMALLSDEQKSGHRKSALNIYAAINSGSIDQAESIAKRNLDAAKNSGDQEAIDSAKMISQLIKQDPDSAKTVAGLFLSESMGVDEFATTLDKLNKNTESPEIKALNLKKMASDIGLTNAQTKKINKEVEKLGIEGQKAVVELEAMKSGKKPIDTEKVFEQEKKLRDEYQKRIKTFTEMKGTMSGLESSYSMQNGVGDLALVTAFMKMLDPGSVVRESEFANARDTGGLLNKLKTMKEKVATGDLIAPAQRKSFLALARKYFNAYEGEQKKTKKDLEAVVKNYNLTSENVFGVDGEAESVAEDATAANDKPTEIPAGTESATARKYDRFLQ